jgi:hypothetical protein
MKLQSGIKAKKSGKRRTMLMLQARTQRIRMTLTRPTLQATRIQRKRGI